MIDYHLAQVNIASMVEAIDSPVMADFVKNLDRINTLAENSKGFIWRLKGEENNATALRVFDDDYMIVNMSVWESKETLFNFTYASEHVEVFKRKKEWFYKLTDMHMYLWFVKPGHEPSSEEAKERLEYRNQNGDTFYSFGFKGNYFPENTFYNSKSDL